MGNLTGRRAATALALGGTAHLLLAGRTDARSVLTLVAAVGAVVLVADGVRRLPAATRLPWTLVALGVASIAVGDAAQAGMRLLSDAPTPFPNPLHLLYSLGAGLMGCGVVAMARRARARDAAALVDAAIVVASVGTVVWVLVLGPAWSQLAVGTVGGLQAAAYPVTHLLLFVALIRLAMTAPWSLPAARTLVAGCLATVVVGTTVGVLISLGRYGPASAQGISTLATFLLVAHAVRHPSAARLVERRASEQARRSPWRVVLLATVLLLLPAAGLVVASATVDVVVAGATAAVVLLLIARLGLLLRELERGKDREVLQAHERGIHRLESLLRHASDVLLVVDRVAGVTYATPSAREVFGEDPVGWSGARVLDQIHCCEGEAARERLLDGLATAGRPVRIQLRLRDHGETEHHVEAVAVDLTDDPDVGGIVLTFHDTTERVQLERRLRHLAFHDPLTGLCNRELLQQRLHQALASTAVDEQRRMAVLLCDLDDFKDVNDTYGHATGDRLLVGVAERLCTAARPTDTVARLGGDEFAVLCEGIDDEHAALEVARAILAATADPILVDGRPHSFAVSIGVAVDDGSRSGVELLRDADIALYDAKDDGKQRWSLHRRAMTERAHERLQLASDLSRAVAGDQLEVAFQPIVRLSDERIVAVEALARWEHPELGWMDPADFIQMAETNGEIEELGERILERSLRALRGWLDQRPELDLRMAVNLSVRQMRDPALPDRVEAMLRRFGIGPWRLVLELTESMMLDDGVVCLEAMRRLRALGVTFAVDDFGTGYSSLAYLRRLPVDVLKTDRDFVREITTDAASADLIRAVVDMARSLDVRVTAEGVETPAQRDLLRAVGCDYAQGFLFARPASGRPLDDLLLDPDGPALTTITGAVPSVGPALPHAPALLPLGRTPAAVGRERAS